MKALFCLFAALFLLTGCTNRKTRHESDLLEAAGRLTDNFLSLALCCQLITYARHHISHCIVSHQ